MCRTLLLIVAVLLFVPLSVTAQEESSCPPPTDNPAPTLTYESLNGEDLSQDISTQILSYLNGVGSSAGLLEALENIFVEDIPLITAQVFESDITGDNELNVLVNVNFSYGGGYDNVLALFGCADGQYIWLNSHHSYIWYHTNEDPPTSIIFISDMNNNQRPEIVRRQTFVQQKFQEAVTIFEWNGTELIQTFTTGYSLGFFGDVVLENADNNEDTLELIVDDRWGFGQATAGAVIEITEWRDVQRTYAWDGDAYTLICKVFVNDAESRPGLLNAEAHRGCGNIEAAMEIYQSLFDNPDLAANYISFPADTDDYENTPNLSNAYLRAFLYYRIIQFHLLNGSIEDAQTTLDLALSEYVVGQRGYQYVAMANTLLETYLDTNDLNAACDAAEITFNQIRENGDDPGIPYFTGDNGEYNALPFYLYNGVTFAPDPDNMFDVPDDIADMVDFPICIQ